MKYTKHMYIISIYCIYVQYQYLLYLCTESVFTVRLRLGGTEPKLVRTSLYGGYNLFHISEGGGIKNRRFYTVKRWQSWERGSKNADFEKTKFMDGPHCQKMVGTNPNRPPMNYQTCIYILC